MLTGLQWVHCRFYTPIGVDYPIGLPFDMFLVEGLSGHARGRHDIDIEMEIMTLDKFPDFLLCGYLAGRIVGYGMSHAIWRWRPGCLEDSIIPGVSSDDAIVNTTNEWRGSKGATSENDLLDRGLSDGRIHDRSNTGYHGGDDIVWVRDDVGNVGSVNDSRSAFDCLIISAISTQMGDGDELDGADVGI